MKLATTNPTFHETGSRGFFTEVGIDLCLDDDAPTLGFLARTEQILLSSIAKMLRSVSPTLEESTKANEPF